MVTRHVNPLEAARAASAHQRTWFAETRARVEAGEPFAVVNADAPHELFRAFDIPYVVNQWWASVCAAKQRSGPYLGGLRERGYPDWSDQYGSLALASALADDPEPPWGGLPRPTFLVAHLTDDAQRKIFELWARASGATFHPLSATVANEVPPRWHETIHRAWEETIGGDRIDLMVAELHSLIETIERVTGRRFDEQRFAETMRLANEQAEWNARTRDLIAATSPAPVSVADAIPAVMLPQWHRGTRYAVDAARALYEEVAALAAAGAGPDERLRLMWVGRGLWFDMGFYRRFEERHGAVFVWSMYLAVAADAYLRYGDDPLRALAARFAAFGDQINMPPWSSEWYAAEAVRNRVDGVVHLVGDALRGAPFITRALERAGIPVCEIRAHNVDQRAWDAEAIEARVTAFVEGLA
ncbi:MAG TPA: 2-hydroxyacyl-CoA dehydratase family protein [Gaiellaceae bacterium]